MLAGGAVISEAGGNIPGLHEGSRADPARTRTVIIAPLGAGGMGQVYRAHDARLQRDVAIKVLPSDLLADPAATARMVRESRLVAALEHPSVITIHDVGEETGSSTLSRSSIEGETLRARFQPWRCCRCGRCSTSRRAIASALGAAHARGVVHRDLKPENVMITATGAVKVLDFGVAKFVAPPDSATEVAQTQLTNQGGIVGTPAYMAPEQLEGRDLDHRADQFAFGVLVYEMLAGVRPFGGATTAELSASILRDEPRHLSAVRADVPVPLARIVTRCLAKDPGRRYDSTTDLAHAISDVSADLALLTPASPVKSAPRRRAIAWGAAALAAAIVLAGFVIGRAPPRGWAPGDGWSSGDACVVVLPFTTSATATPISPTALPRPDARTRSHRGHTRHRGEQCIRVSRPRRGTCRTNRPRAWCGCAGARLRSAAASGCASALRCSMVADDATLWSQSLRSRTRGYSCRPRRYRVAGCDQAGDDAWGRRRRRGRRDATGDAGSLRRVPPRHRPSCVATSSRFRRGHCRARTSGRSRPEFRAGAMRGWPAPIRSSSSTTPRSGAREQGFVEIEKALAINP